MDKLKIKIPDWGVKFLTPRRYKGLKGGRSGGKSHFFGELLIRRMITNPHTQGVCVREIQKSLKFSAKKLLEDKIKKFKCSHLFDITQTEIRRIGGDGIIIFQGLQDHTSDSIKSLEGFDICWVEEAQSISSHSLEILLPTIRAEKSEIWCSWNPNNPEDPIEKLFSEQSDDMIFDHINFYDNPACPEEVKKEAARHKEFSPETYDHVWLGVANAGIEHAFIKPEWVRGSIDAHKKLDVFSNNFGRAIIGFDVADEGSDSNAITNMRGSIVHYSDEWYEGDTGESTRKVNSKAKIEMCGVVYDSVGVGAGAKSESNRLISSGDGVKFTPFNAGSSVPHPDSIAQEGTEILNKDFFSNAKAYYWWQLRQRFYNTYLAVTKGNEYNIDQVISLSSENQFNDKLVAELSRCKIDYDNNGRLKVESKKDLAKRGAKSPNIADSLVMCLVEEESEIFVG